MPLPSSMLQQQSYPSPVSTTAPPSKRQRSQASIMPSMQPRIQSIDNQLQKLQTEPGYNCNMLETPRYNILRDACNNEDTFYIVLHQLFCIWDLPDPTQITAIPEFPNSTALRLSFNVIGLLIRENDSLRQAHKLWFAQFPTPLAILLKSSSPYQRVVQDVGKFLGKLHVEWKKLSMECFSRKYPPLVDELVGRMGLLSPTLQQVIFTAIRRNLGVVDDSWGQRMEEVFNRDRKEHQALSARYNTARPPTQKEVDGRNKNLTNEYLLLYTTFSQARNQASGNPSSPVTRLPNPVVPSNGTIAAGVHSTNVQRNNSWGQDVAAPRRASMMAAPQAGNVRIPAISSPGISTPMTAGPLGSNVYQQPSQVVTSPANFRGPSALSPAHAYSDINMQYLPGANNVLYPGQIRSSLHTNVVQRTNPALLDQQNIQQHLWARQNQQMHLQQHTPATQHVQQQHAFMGQFPQAQTPQMYGQLTANPHSRRISAGITDYRPTSNTRVASNTTTPRTPLASVNGALHWQGGLNSEQVMQNGTTNVSPITNQNRAMHQSTPVQQTFTVGPRLLPDRMSQARPHIVDPDKTALHQAHLRSPKLIVPLVPHLEKPQDDSGGRCYQIVKSLAFGPSQLRSDAPLTKFDFTISREELSRIPKDNLSSSTGRMGTRLLQPGALQYRVRCIQTRPEVTHCLMPDWMASDTSWPESSFIGTCFLVVTT
jgi:hypothetical protein